MMTQQSRPHESWVEEILEHRREPWPSHITYLIDYIDTLTAERDALKAEVERLLGGLRAMEPYFVHTCNYRNTLDEACVECLRERLLSPEGTQR